MIPSDPKQIRSAITRTLNQPVAIPAGWVAGTLLAASVGLIAAGGLGYNPLKAIDRGVTELSAPILQTVSEPFRKVGQSVQDLARFNTLRQENAVLKAENERLRTWYAESLRLKAENQSLRGFAALPLETAPVFERTGRIIADTGGPFSESVLIRLGKADGVQIGDVALSGGNVVGRVTDVTANTARILLINDVNARVPVLVQSSRHRGILAGTNGRHMRLMYTQADATISVGDRLVTSGHGGVFGPDIPVAIVTKVSPEGVTARPFADLSRLEMVRVIRFFE